jgi:hypothetical protein
MAGHVNEWVERVADQGCMVGDLTVCLDLTVRDVYYAVLFYLMLLIWWMMARERKMGDGDQSKDPSLLFWTEGIGNRRSITEANTTWSRVSERIASWD